MQEGASLFHRRHRRLAGSFARDLYIAAWRLGLFRPLAAIKAQFTRQVVAAGVPVKRHRNGEYDLWQRRFWEHTIGSDTDFERHVDYVHFNPVKHRLVTGPRDWPYSSFHAYVRRGLIPEDWAGDVKEGNMNFGERGD
jgi:putative transposase